MDDQILYSKTNVKPSGRSGHGDDDKRTARIDGQWVYVFPSEEDFLSCVVNLLENPELVVLNDDEGTDDDRKTHINIINILRQSGTERAARFLYYFSKKSIERGLPIFLNHGTAPIVSSLDKIESFVSSDAWHRLSKREKTLIMSAISGSEISHESNAWEILIILASVLAIVIGVGAFAVFLVTQGAITDELLKLLITVGVSGFAGAAILAIINKLK